MLAGSMPVWQSTWKPLISPCILVQSLGERACTSHLWFPCIEPKDLYSNCSTYFTYQPLTEVSFMPLQGRVKEENYWRSWNSDCRSNEKHLKDTLKYEILVFWVNRQMQMIPILRFFCHHFFRPRLPPLPSTFFPKYFKRREDYLQNFDCQSARLCQKSWLKPDSMQTVPWIPIEAIQI